MRTTAPYDIIAGMRIIAGEFGGRRIAAPKGIHTRPTSDRVREALFSILGGSVRGARVLDPFAGSGALGFEALSRGASFATFVDSDRGAARCVAENAKALGVLDRIERFEGDWEAALGRMGGGFYDIAFLDPPYRMAGECARVAERLYRARRLAEGAILIAEEPRDAEGGFPPPFEVYDVRTYSDTRLSFMRIP